MRFQRIGTREALARTATILLLLLLATGPAFAVDEDIPPPTDTELPPPGGSASPAPRTSPLSEDESIPAPSIGDESLPEPSVDRGQENTKNQVNRPPEDDEIFLPTPNVNDNVYYAPVGTPAPRVTNEDVDWRVMNTNRPGFSLYAGFTFKGYANTYVKSNRVTGTLLGASARIFSLAQTVHAHAFASYAWTKIGDVGSVPNVSEETLEAGAMFELTLSRRFSLFGTIFRRNARVEAPLIGITNYAVLQDRNVSDIGNIGEEPAWFLGASAQWDFYVIPHGSMGLHAHLERDLYQVLLTFALEPVTRKKVNLNYRDMESD